jgi:uncharacterized protein YggE
MSHSCHPEVLSLDYKKRNKEVGPMKALPIFLAGTILLSTFVPSVLVEETEAIGSISVAGDAVVKVVPDEVVLTLGVETRHEDLSVAKRHNDERVQRVIASAKYLGVPEKYIQTDFINISPEYEYRNSDIDRIVGYRVGKTIQITLRDIEQFDELLTSALESGANYVHGIDFRTTELRKYRDQARALAIQAAQEKAQALAEELGRTAGEPQSIVEQSSGWWSSYNSWWGSRWGSYVSQNVIQNAGLPAFTTEGGTALGQISVNASVQVTFELK